MATIELRDVTKDFGGVQVIHGANLSIEDNEFVVFVGPSGCGKSTLLRLLSGLEELSSGEIHIDGERVDHLPPARRGLAMVFQSYALYPHMTVFQNMSYALKVAKKSKQEIEAKVHAAAEILQLTELLDRKPKALSGGQRQRVAIGRAIVRDPKVFLFDEPLSNLDAKLRVQMRIELTNLHQQLQSTMIYVTHDQVEAMTMADKIVVLQAGRVEQVGSPLELYRSPANRFVAGFIGSPKMNFVEGAEAKKQGAYAIGIRPEHLEISTTEGTWAGTVGVAEHLGSDTFLHVHVDGFEPMTVRVQGEADYKYGDQVYLTPQLENLHRFDSNGASI